jgi:hypothetical protein
MNRELSSSSTTGYKGVHFWKARKKFRALISKDGKQHYIGVFPTAEAAALAYNKAAKKLHGKFARLNIAPSHVSASCIKIPVY